MSKDMWRRFRKHKLGIIGLIFVLILFIVTGFAEFFAPYGVNSQHVDYMYLPPQRLHFFDEQGRFHFIPFVYGLKHEFDVNTGKDVYKEDKTRVYRLKFFVHGDYYRILFFKSNVHLFGVEKGGYYFPLGTDRLGRDLLSLLLYGGRISLLIGLLTTLAAMSFGAIVGILSGYYGGVMDLVVQRIIEVFMSVPDLPLLMLISASLPARLPPVYRVLIIIGILTSVGWTGLARQIRGKVLAIREEDYVMAAKAIGAGKVRVMIKYLLPNTLSHVIVVSTLKIPGVILSESSLSFLGLGIKPPLTSWGLLLRRAQNVQVMQSYPWLLLPGFCIMIAVLAFNFLGDALRDAADPFATRRG